MAVKNSTKRSSKVAETRLTVIDTKRLNSIGNTMIILAATLISIIGLRYIAQDLLAPILMAVFFAAIMYPFFKSLRQRGYKSSSAMAVMILVSLASIVGVVLFVTWSFHLVSTAVQPVFDEFQANMTQTLTNLGIDMTSATAMAEGISPNQLLQFASSILGQFSNVAMYFVLVPIMAILLVLQADKIPPEIINELSEENTVLVKGKRFASSISLYISNRFKVNAVTGLLLFVLMTILGIPFAFVWGFLAMIMSFVPYIGLFIAGAPPTILAFMAGGLPLAIAVVVGIVLINFFVENVLDPMVQSSTNKISTAAVVIAFVFWTWLLGPVGAILSTPLTVLMKMMFNDYQETHWVSTLMEGDYEQTKQELKKENGLKGWWHKLPASNWLAGGAKSPQASKKSAK